MEQEGEAGSFFGSESGPEQEQESQHVVEQGVNFGAADSVNYGAQSPRVPRSQISRAHPGQTLGYAERTSAVLSALSGDDETALSAAEAAGEHTSNPAGPVAAPSAAAPPGDSAAPAHQQAPQQQQLLPPTAAAAGSRQVGGEDPLSPPESTSPMYRANSVVSHTAAPLRLPPLKRPVDTPGSAGPLHGALLGASPTTSRVEYSQRLPYGPPPTAVRPFSRPHSAPQQGGTRPHSQQQQQYPPQQQPQQPHPPLPQHQQSPAAPLPSYASLSQAGQQPQSVATHPGSLPSTLGLAMGMAPPPLFPPPAFPPVPATPPAAGTPPPAAGTPPPAAASNFAAWVGLAASMGVPLEVLQAHGSAIEGSGGQPTRLQQAEALQSMAAALQAQASVILQQQQQQQQVQHAAAAAAQQAQQAAHVLQAASEGMQRGVGGASTAAAAGPSSLLHQQQAHMHQLEAAPQPQHAVIEASAGPGMSMYSVPDLVGASVIQGHPLPPPFYGSGTAAGAPVATAPTLVSGVTLSHDGGAGADATPATQLQHAAEPAAGSSLRPGSGARGSASPTAAMARDPRLQPAQAPASSACNEPLHMHAQHHPQHATGHPPGLSPRAAAPADAGGAADAAAASAARQGWPRGAGEHDAQPLPSTDAAAIGGNLGPDDAADGLEVQQAAPSPAAAGGAMLADTGDDAAAMDDAAAAQRRRREASGEGAGGEGRPPGTLPPGKLPPAPHGAASVMATLVSSGQQSDVESEISGMRQQAASGPHSHPAAAEVQSPLPSMQPAAATTNAHMSLSLVAATASQPARPAQQQQQQHSTSGQSPPGQGAAGSRLATVETGADDDAAGGSVDMTAPASRRHQHQPALSAPLPAPGAAPAEGGGAAGGPGPAAHPAVSAPMVLPGQQQQPEQPQPAMSVSLSAHREGAGGPPGHFAENNPVAPQAQSSAFVFKHHQRHSGWEEHDTSLPPPAPPQGAAMEEGEGQQPQEGRGSPRASLFDAPPAASGGTARGTILAGQAHSILTTAAAGEGDHAEVGEGEALSPLVVGRPARAIGAGRHAGAAPRGLVSGGPPPSSSQPQAAAAASPAAAAAAAVGAPHGPAGPAPGEPMNFSTMAQDLGGAAGEGGGEEPEPTLLSGQQPGAAGAPQHGAHSAGYGAEAMGQVGGGGAESVHQCGTTLGGGAHEGGTPGTAAEVAQRDDGAANGEAAGGSGPEEEAANGYASSIILGNGLLGGGSGGAAALGAAVAAVAAAVGSELTSPSSVSGKRRQQAKRKRGGDG